MVHTKRIIERSVGLWAEWPGHRILHVEAAFLPDKTDAEEVCIELEAARHPFFISWQQEDGACDGLLFHWLSMQPSPHFKEESVVKNSAPTLPLAQLRGLIVERVELYGSRGQNAVFAALVLGQGRGVGFATARELGSKCRFSRFGSADLVVSNEDRLLREVARQGLERIISLGAESRCD